MKKIIGCFLLVLIASSCSWHLRGSVSVPQQITTLYLSAEDGKGALISELQQLLRANHVNLVDDSLLADYSLNILDENKDKRTAGVGNDALSSAYEITLKVDYEIRLKNNTRIAKAAATSVRSFNYNTATINSATQEEVLLEKEMRSDLAQQILRRLNAAVAHPQVEKEKETKTSTNGETLKNSEPLPNPNGDSNGKTAP